MTRSSKKKTVRQKQSAKTDDSKAKNTTGPSSGLDKIDDPNSTELSTLSNVVTSKNDKTVKAGVAAEKKMMETKASTMSENPDSGGPSLKDGQLDDTRHKPINVKEPQYSDKKPGFDDEFKFEGTKGLDKPYAVHKNATESVNDKQVEAAMKESMNMDKNKVTIVAGQGSYDPASPESNTNKPSSNIVGTTMALKTVTTLTPILDSAINVSLFREYTKNEGFIPLPIKNGAINVLEFSATPLSNYAVLMLKDEYDIPAFSDPYDYFNSYLAWVLTSIEIHDGIRTNIDEAPNPIYMNGKLPKEIGINFMKYLELFTSDRQKEITSVMVNVSNQVIRKTVNTGKYYFIMHPSSFKLMTTLHDLQVSRLVDPDLFRKYFTLTDSDYNVVLEIPDKREYNKNYWIGAHNIHFQMYDGSYNMLMTIYNQIISILPGFIKISTMKSDRLFKNFIQPLGININTLNSQNQLAVNLGSLNSVGFYWVYISVFLLSDFMALFYNPFNSNTGIVLSILDCVLAPLVIKQSCLTITSWTLIHNYIFHYLVLPATGGVMPVGYSIDSAARGDTDYLLESFNDNSIYGSKAAMVSLRNALKNHFGSKGDGDFGVGNGSAQTLRRPNKVPEFKEGDWIYEPISDANYDLLGKDAIITKINTLRDLSLAIKNIPATQITGINSTVLANSIMSFFNTIKPYRDLQYNTHIMLRSLSALTILKQASDDDYQTSNQRPSYYADKEVLSDIQTFITDSSLELSRRVIPLDKQSYPTEIDYVRKIVEIGMGSITGMFMLEPSGMIVSTNFISQMKSSMDFTCEIYEFAKNYNIYRMFLPGPRFSGSDIYRAALTPLKNGPVKSILSDEKVHYDMAVSRRLQFYHKIIQFDYKKVNAAMTYIDEMYLYSKYLRAVYYYPDMFPYIKSLPEYLFATIANPVKSIATLDYQAWELTMRSYAGVELSALVNYDKQTGTGLYKHGLKIKIPSYIERNLIGNQRSYIATNEAFAVYYSTDTVSIKIKPVTQSYYFSDSTAKVSSLIGGLIAFPAFVANKNGLVVEKPNIILKYVQELTTFRGLEIFTNFEVQPLATNFKTN